MTEHIKKEDAAHLSKALHLSRDIGAEPDWWVTVHWGKALSKIDPADRLQRLIRRMGLWLYRKTGRSPVWAYAREVGPQYGEHVHMVVCAPHVRRPADLEREIMDWISLDMEEPETIGAKAVKVARIKPGDLVRGDGIKGYMLKEGADDVHQLYDLPERYRQKRTGYPVAGKRIGVSLSIGKAAQKRQWEARP